MLFSLSKRLKNKPVAIAKILCSGSLVMYRYHRKSKNLFGVIKDTDGKTFATVKWDDGEESCVSIKSLELVVKNERFKIRR